MEIDIINRCNIKRTLEKGDLPIQLWQHLQQFNMELQLMVIT